MADFMFFLVLLKKGGLLARVRNSKRMEGVPKESMKVKERLRETEKAEGERGRSLQVVNTGDGEPSSFCFSLESCNLGLQY